MKKILLLLLVWFSSLSYAADGQPPLLVYGAASLSNVLQDLGPAFTQKTGREVKLALAASSTLARQIDAGANADIFFSADLEWMDYLQSRSLIDVRTRTNLLGNTLVLIAPADSKVALDIAPGFPLAKTLGDGRLATGDPDSVPVGKYARSALMQLGVWNDVVDKLVRADNVRAALAFVGRGEAPLGIVYLTDALIDKHVRVVDEFPARSHPAIVYPIAVTAKATAGADAFIAFLRGPDAQATFNKYGFTVLPHSGTRTSNTGTDEARRTFSASLPSAQRPSPRRPCVPIAIKSAGHALALSRMSPAARVPTPSISSALAATPASAANFCAAASTLRPPSRSASMAFGTS